VWPPLHLSSPQLEQTQPSAERFLHNPAVGPTWRPRLSASPTCGGRLSAALCAIAGTPANLPDAASTQRGRLDAGPPSRPPAHGDYPSLSSSARQNRPRRARKGTPAEAGKGARPRRHHPCTRAAARRLGPANSRGQLTSQSPAGGLRRGLSHQTTRTVAITRSRNNSEYWCGLIQSAYDSRSPDRKKHQPLRANPAQIAAHCGRVGYHMVNLTFHRGSARDQRDLRRDYG
jgi:hypothetical protein